MKGFLQSRTVWGLLLLLLNTVAGLAGFRLSDAQLETFATYACDAIGFGLSIWGTAARPELSGLWRRAV